MTGPVASATGFANTLGWMTRFSHRSRRYYGRRGPAYRKKI